MGVSCVVDSIAGTTGLVDEQNVTNHMGVRINPTAQFQPATHVHRLRCWMRWMWYRYIPSVFNVHQTLRVEVITAGLNNRANSESEISYWVCTHGSSLQRLLSLEHLKCGGCALGGHTHVRRPVVLQIANWAAISCCDNCSLSSNCKHVIFLWRIHWYAFCVQGLQR